MYPVELYDTDFNLYASFIITLFGGGAYSLFIFG